MKITKNTVIKMHYAVSDSEDTLIDSSYDHQPLEMIQGAGYMIKGLEAALEGHQTGDKFAVEVAADDAYGQRHDGFVQTIAKEMFGEIEDLQVGSQLRATTDDGEQTVIVIDMTDEDITVDGNHPLAGIDLKFEVEILAVRTATEEEIAHGHVHAAGGCGHDHQEHHDEGGCCGGHGSDEKNEGGCCGDGKGKDDENQGGCGCAH
jgi:FKBP-type peptidyl-prolyl cis-trans isomerase SlyD